MNEKVASNTATAAAMMLKPFLLKNEPTIPLKNGAQSI
jgi:hypothetical protein